MQRKYKNAQRRRQTEEDRMKKIKKKNLKKKERNKEVSSSTHITRDTLKLCVSLPHLPMQFNTPIQPK